MKKIVVLTGSARRRGNSAALAEAFIDRARELGHEVTRFDAAFMKVNACIGCEACYKKGRACVFDDDDFNSAADAIERADAVVVATPMYWYSFPAKLKAVFDKFNSFDIGRHAIGGKTCALMVTAAEEAEPMEGMLFSWRRMTERLEWRSVGEVLVPFVHAPGDIHKTDGPARVEALAEMV